MVKNSPCNAGDTGSIPGQGTKPASHSERVSETQPKIPHAATETRHNQIDFFFKDKMVHIFSVQKYDWMGLGSRFQNSRYRMSLAAAAAAAKSLQSCPTLCDPRDSSPPGSPIPGILQARTLEWVAISFSSAWKWKVKVKSLSRVWLPVTPWNAAYQAPPSMGFSRQEYWSGVPLPSPEWALCVCKNV